MILFTETLSSPLHAPVKLTAEWRKRPIREAHAMCEMRYDSVKIILAGSCVHIQSIIHEVYHAVEWCAICNVIGGNESRAHYCGLWSEEIMSAMLRKGWVFGKKNDAGVLWNKDVSVALVRKKP